MSHAPRSLSRRTLLAGAGGLAAAGSLGLSAPAHGIGDGHGLRIVDQAQITDRLRYFRFRTRSVSWNPGVNVLLPADYETSGKRYPVIHLLHGGNGDFRNFHMGNDIVGSTAGLDVIVVMPDAATGWYCNAVLSLFGPRNWETFHMAELLPWIDSNFRTFPEYAGRAVAGFSMGGFGALKYTAKYHGHFSAVTCLSGPGNLRDGWVGHWANTSGAIDNGIVGGIYGVPWVERRVSADNPVERIESYRNKRIALYCGTGGDIQETRVRVTQGQFSAKLNEAGIEHTWIRHEGGHGSMVTENLRTEMPQIVAHLRRAE